MQKETKTSWSETTKPFNLKEISSSIVDLVPKLDPEILVTLSNGSTEKQNCHIVDTPTKTKNLFNAAQTRRNLKASYIFDRTI